MRAGDAAKGQWRGDQWWDVGVQDLVAEGLRGVRDGSRLLTQQALQIPYALKRDTPRLHGCVVVKLETVWRTFASSAEVTHAFTLHTVKTLIKG